MEKMELSVQKNQILSHTQTYIQILHREKKTLNIINQNKQKNILCQFGSITYGTV